MQDPFFITTVTRLIAKFEETGSVADKPRSGRPSVTEDTVEEVKQVLRHQSSTSDLGSTSVRAIATEVAVSKTTVHKILRNTLNLFPYKLQRLQSLEESDRPKRVEFAEWLLAHREIIPDILWSDKANFSLDGMVNTHNCRILVARSSR